MGMTSSAARAAAAMARSKWVPALGRQAGVRLMVRACAGHDRPAEATAARHRSRASYSEVSGSPTRMVRGRPLAVAASTSTIVPATPMRATDRALARVIGPPLAHE